MHNRLVNYDLFTGQPQFAGKTNEYGNNSLYYPYNLGLDFQPRLGLAWSPKALGGKTVIRAGYTLSSFFEGTGINLRMSTELRRWCPPNTATTAGTVASRAR